MLGGERWTPAERADRFAEFLPLLDRLLTEPATTAEGRFYSAWEARSIPGCVQRPRLPFVVAGNGPRGMGLAARYGQGWVTTGDRAAESADPRSGVTAVAAQIGRLRGACEKAGRDVGELHKVLLTGFAAEPYPESLDAFVDFAGRYAEVGIDEIVLHWPIPDSIFAAGHAAFERIATEGARQLQAAGRAGG